jgi:putative endonuclease
MGKKETGDTGEKLAQHYLKKHGFRIIETNYTCLFGEIDIVSMKKNTLVFTEVRTRTGTYFGTPEESISSRKKTRMRRSAYHYLQNHTKLPPSWRIDFIGVELDSDGKVVRIDLIENAVGETNE